MDIRKLLAENEELHRRLEEAEETISAIRNGEVDALVVFSGEGDKIFTLEGADHPYRVLVETMSEGAATLGPDSTVLFCNSRLAQLLKMPMERILGKPLLSHIVPTDVSSFTALLSRSLNQDCLIGESFRTELSLLSEKGDLVPTLFSCCALDLAGSRGISVIVTDLSEQKRTEELISAGTLASSILEQAGEAIIVCDENGQVIRASQKSHELFGFNPLFQSFDGMVRLQKSDSGPPFSISAPLSGKFLQGLEVKFQRDDGTFYLLLNAQPLRQHKILGCVVTLTDITGRKLDEEKIKKAHADAEEANRAKSEFLANMSHEIRTPMTVFMSAVDHLLYIEQNPDHRKLLNMAEQASKRLLGLIDDILNLSRIEARRLDTEEIPFDLRDNLRGVAELFFLPIREKNLRIETDVSPEIPRMVTGDPEKIGQVLINLIGNAIKFTHHGEVRVCIRERQDFLEFSVIDTGIGINIPEEKQHLIFQSFTQEDSSFTRKFGGTGLGLAISKGLVELMGGQIFFQSRPEGGSVFVFTIPLKIAEKQRSEEEAPWAGMDKEQKTVRILLAEDDPMIREVVALMLSHHGLKPEIAESGRKAVEKWRVGDFDLILMDLQMPEMNGLEATRAIRNQETAGGRKRTCIVGLTAHASREIKEQCLGSGMDRVLTKPVKIKDLLSVVTDCS